jgi:hypothetical protein
MSAELREELAQCRDVGEIVNLVTNTSLEYSGIQRWTFVRDAERRVLRFFLELSDRRQHAALAKLLGGQVIDGEISFEVPLQYAAPPQERRPSPLAPDLLTPQVKGPPASQR